MEEYTQEDLDGFGEVKGCKICPTGDYTLIKVFKGNCKFGDFCKFGNGCKFGEYCKFGNGCKFGDCSEFGDYCKFGHYCKLGDGSKFGDCSEFNRRCKFGNDCKFGDNCKFGEFCNYGDNCNYENGMVVNGRFMCFKNIGTENREAYLYIDEDKRIFLRAGCFFGDLEEFNKHCKVEGVANKTIKQYLVLFKTGKELLEISD